ncbi:MAG: tetratricopeptide repeat protein [Thermoplasmata archaeon]
MERKEKEKIILELRNITHEKVILLSGREGVGKSYLLNEICNEISKETICIYTSPNEISNKDIFNIIVEKIKKIFPSIRLGILEALSKTSLDSINTLISIVSVISSFKVVILIFDDIENLSKEFYDSLYYLIKSLKENKVVFILSYDENFLNNDSRELIIKLNELPEKDLIRIELKGLSKDEFENYIKENKYVIPNYILDKIYDITEGSPGLVNQILFELKSKGLFDEDNYWVGTFEDLPKLKSEKFVPLDILKIIDENELDLLSYASVYGVNFNLEDIVNIKNMRFDIAVEIINSLVNKGIIVEIDGRNFKFLRMEYREIIYNSMSNLKRRYIHKKIAEYLENHCDCPDIIGNHFFIAGEKEKARKYLISAAIKKSKELNHKESLEFLKKYFEITPEPEFDMLLLMIDTLIKLGRFKEALKFIEMAENKKKDDINVNLKKAFVYYNLGNYVECEKILSSMEKIWDQLSDETKFYYFFIKGSIESRRYNIKEAEKLFEKSYELANKLNDLYLIAMNYKEIGILHYYNGNFETSYQYFLNSLQIYEKIKDLEGISRIYNNLSLIDLNKDLKKALDEYQKSLIYADMSSNTYLSIAIRLNISQIYFWIGMVKEAEKEIEVALNISKTTEEVEIRHSIYSYLSDFYMMKGNFDMAIDYITNAIKISISMGSNFYKQIYEVKRNIILNLIGKVAPEIKENYEGEGIIGILMDLYRGLLLLSSGKFSESAELLFNSLEKGKEKLTFLDIVMFEGNLPFAYLMANNKEKFLEYFYKLNQWAEKLGVDMIYIHTYRPSIDFIEKGERTLEKEEEYFLKRDLKFLLLKTYIIYYKITGDQNVLEKIKNYSKIMNFNYSIFL